MFTDHRTSHHRHAARHHLHRRRPLRPRAAAGDQEAGPPRTAPARRHHRAPGRDRGARPVSGARLLQPVRLRGARARLQRRCRRSAHRRHAAVRRCAAGAGGVARRLADAERRRGAAVGVRPAAAPRVDLRHRCDRTGGVGGGGVGGTERTGARLRAGRTVAPAEPQPPPLVLDSAGRQKLVEEAAGKSARQVRQMLADLDPELAPPADRVRPLGNGGYELKAIIDAECQQGLEQLRGLLSHVDPRMTMGQLVGRIVQEALDRHDPSRPPRRARSGSRPADAKATAPPTPTPEQAQGSSAPAAKRAARPADTVAAPKTDPDAGHHAAPTPEWQPAVVRHAVSTTKDAAIPADAAPTPAPAVRPIPTPAPPPSTQEETARRAATGAKPTSAATPAAKSCVSGRAIPAAVRRQVWQRDGGRCSYVDPQTGRRCNSTHLIEIDHIVPGNLRLCGAHHRHRHAHGRSPREPAS